MQECKLSKFPVERCPFSGAINTKNGQKNQFLTIPVHHAGTVSPRTHTEDLFIFWNVASLWPFFPRFILPINKGCLKARLDRNYSLFLDWQPHIHRHRLTVVRSKLCFAKKNTKSNIGIHFEYLCAAHSRLLSGRRDNRFGDSVSAKREL